MTDRINLAELREWAKGADKSGAPTLLALVEAVEAAQGVAALEQSYSAHEEEDGGDNEWNVCATCGKWLVAMEALEAKLARFDFGGQP